MKKIFLFIALSVLCYAASALPRVHVIATGGTIAGQSCADGYQAGQVSIENILAAVPQLGQLAELDYEQFCNIGSQDMDETVWLPLSKRVNAVLSGDRYDAVVITHGTDTMEETAFFLNLTVHSEKPVVLVGSMRPSDAVDADGPANLVKAVQTAVSPESAGKEVMCCIGGKIFEAGGVYKNDSHAIDAFAQTASDWCQPHGEKTGFDVEGLEALPKVGIVYGYASSSAVPMKAFADAGYDGIVLAGVGGGNFNAAVQKEAENAVGKGIMVVRSTRCLNGGVYTEGGEVPDNELGFIAAGRLSPQKARVLLMLSLTVTRDLEQIRTWFMKGVHLESIYTCENSNQSGYEKKCCDCHRHAQ